MSHHCYAQPFEVTAVTCVDATDAVAAARTALDLAWQLATFTVTAVDDDGYRLNSEWSVERGHASGNGRWQVEFTPVYVEAADVDDAATAAAAQLGDCDLTITDLNGIAPVLWISAKAIGQTITTPIAVPVITR